MKSIDAAIDEYLHTIVRTRPWTKKREEELLEGFTGWLFDQPQREITLDALTVDDLQRYASAARLDDAERDDLVAALYHVFLWSIRQGWITTNPFEAVAVA
jgi:site-specific recombinase XerD